MRTTRERIVFLASAVVSGYATIALASAATSSSSIDSSSYRHHPRNWSDAVCMPNACTRVVETDVGGPPSTLY